MSAQLIIQNGQPEWAVLPYGEYLKLVEQAEMLEDIQDYDHLHAAVQQGSEELLPAALVFELADGANPVKTWREYRKLSQHQLAEKADISVPYLSQLETGKRNASVSVLAKIASILNVDIDDLIPMES